MYCHEGVDIVFTISNIIILVLFHLWWHEICWSFFIEDCYLFLSCPALPSVQEYKNDAIGWNSNITLLIYANSVETDIIKMNSGSYMALGIVNTQCYHLRDSISNTNENMQFFHFPEITFGSALSYEPNLVSNTSNCVLVYLSIRFTVRALRVIWKTISLPNNLTLIKRLLRKRN